MKLIACAVACVASLAAQSFPGSQALDSVITRAIEEDRLPGAVAVVGHDGQVVHRKAYGKRAVFPSAEAMTAGTVFDIASLTKVVATTPSLMKLFEQGRFRLNDKITDYIPEFQGGKSDITIRQLLTHFSGLQPDVPLQPVWSGYETGIRLACATPPSAPPGVKFVYSDINFLLLGELVHRLSGKPLNEYARENIWLPLGMKDTTYLPPASWIPRIAPTERPVKGAPPLRGVVHDPTARYMGGVAGHAGVFSTADDLARFAQMMLNKGELNGVRLFSSLTVEKFTEPQSPADQPVLRGLGWDLDSSLSGNRGDLFPIGSYGHTGFTGTSMWIDPSTRSYVILLANSIHPDGRPAITSVRSRVATVAAAGLGIGAQGITLTGYNETLSGVRREVERNAATETGLDVLEARNFDVFRGKRIGLVTNQTGLDRQGRRNVDAMKAAGIQVAALFAPEHGIFGTDDREGIEDAKDAATGIHVFSLYGATQKPTPEMLRGLDALVFDVQDAGVRFYTYETTMAYCMEAAAQAGVPFFVLDRPNPLGGAHVEGPLLDSGNRSFVGYHAGLPVRHGMTLGELARMFNAQNKTGAALTVIPMKDWNRGDWFDSTNLIWIRPSPNLRTLQAAILYPGVAMLEYSENLSVGRGTDTPFEQIGAEFIQGRELASYLNKRGVPGVRFYPVVFTPAESNLKGKRIEGVRFQLTSRELFDSGRFGLEVAAALQVLYPGKIDFAANKRLIGSDDVIRRLSNGEDARAIQEAYRDALDAFVKAREPFLLY